MFRLPFAHAPRALRSLGVAVVLSGAGAAFAAAPASLSTDAIATKLIGQPLFWKADDGPQRGEIFFAPDGRVEMTTTMPGLPRDIGTWRFNGGQLCTRWEQARGGSEKCYEVVETAPGEYRTNGGNTFEARNPWI